MRIIEINAQDNGAHRNQTYHGFLLDGWAVVPDPRETENYPFGEVTVKEVNGVPTVTEWTPLPMPQPEPDPMPEPEEETSVWDELDAAFQEGVNGAYEQ